MTENKIGIPDEKPEQASEQTGLKKAGKSTPWLKLQKKRKNV